MTRQGAIQWLYQHSKWKKKAWVEILGVSYAQLRKWLSPEPVRISPTTVIKAAGLFSFGVEWRDEAQQELNLYPISEELVFSSKMPFSPRSLERLSKIEKPFKTEVAHPSDILEKNQREGEFNLHVFQTRTSTQWAPLAGDLDVSAEVISGEETITIRMGDSSMVPLLKPGMVLLAEPRKEVSSGDLVAVIIPGNGIMIGEYFRNGDIILLVRLNAPPIQISNDVSHNIYKITWINTS